MWWLILVAVHVNNASDVPGVIEVAVASQAACEKSLQSLQYKLKFSQFKIVGRCEQK
jgi:hypothetical protein